MAEEEGEFATFKGWQGLSEGEREMSLCIFRGQDAIRKTRFYQTWRRPPASQARPRPATPGVVSWPLVGGVQTGRTALVRDTVQGEWLAGVLPQALPFGWPPQACAGEGACISFCLKMHLSASFLSH